jgi:hypothetical protein
MSNLGKYWIYTDGAKLFYYKNRKNIVYTEKEIKSRKRKVMHMHSSSRAKKKILSNSDALLTSVCFVRMSWNSFQLNISDHPETAGYTLMFCMFLPAITG